MGYNKPAVWQNVYGSSKAWIRNFTRALAKENTDIPAIGIYALNPGMVLTDLLIHNDVISGSEDRLKVFPTVVRMWAKPPEIPAREAVGWLPLPLMARPDSRGMCSQPGSCFRESSKRSGER